MKNSEIINNLFSTITVVILIGGSIYFWTFLSGLGYKIGGKRGHSKSIKDSKERNVFIKTLGYEFIPNDLELEGFSVYIEKGFRYGEKSYKVTDTLGTDEYQYQLVLSRKNKWNNFGDTVVTSNNINSLREYMPLENPEIKDTLFLNILINKSMYVVDTIGIVKVY